MANPRLAARMCRAARALLGYTQAKLAEQSGLSLATLRRFEVDEGHFLSKRNEDKLLEFLSEKLVLIYNGGRVIGLYEQGTPRRTRKEKLP